MNRKIGTEDGSSVVTNPEEFGALARRRHQEAQARKGAPIERAENGSFRATCPWCRAPNVVMSEVSPSHPTPIAPSPGDVIKCDWCRRFHVVEQVNGLAVKTFPIELESHD